MDAADFLDQVEAAADNGEATLSTFVGGHREQTHVRLWRGQVLVDWEPDNQAGGCLLRPALLRRLVALHATVTDLANTVTFTASGRVVAALSPTHADLVQRLGGPRRVELRITLAFGSGQYLGGVETYVVSDKGGRVTLLKLEAQVLPRSVATNVAAGDVTAPSSRV